MRKSNKGHINEMMVFVAIVAILAAVVVPKYLEARKMVRDQMPETSKRAHFCQKNEMPAIGNVGITEANQKIICVKF